MKKTLIFVIALVVCLATMLTLTACHECEWSGDWSADADTHFHKCTVEGCDKVSDQANHEWANTWTIGDDNHYYKCTTEGCPAENSVTAHVYDQMVESADYLDAEATATTNATYFYSCVCGKKGTTTFEKQKPLAEVSLKEEYLDRFDRQYDADYSYCSKVFINNFPENATWETYFKPQGADDSEYQLQADGVAEDAGKYVMKVVISETVDTAETVLYHEFEITKITGSFNSTNVYRYYTGSTEYTRFGLINFYHSWVVKNTTLYVDFTTTSKAPGIYSTANGTLTIETSNPNYEITSGAFEILQYEISSRTITVEYEEDGIYDIKLGTAQGVKVGDEAYIRINATNANTIGTHEVYRAITNVKNAVWMIPGITGADANCYRIDEKLGWEEQYWITLEIVAPTAEE